MVNQDLLNYVGGEMSRNSSKDKIQSDLLANGWNLKDIEECFSQVAYRNQIKINIPSNLQNTTPAPIINITPEMQPKVVTVKKSKIGLFSILFAIILLLVSCFAYAYIQKIGPFSLSTYSEQNFLSSILSKINQINSASYSVSGSLNVVDRDQSAVPFTIQTSNTQELMEQYYYDTQRLNDVTSIINLLNSTYSQDKSSSRTYPPSLKNIYANNKNSYYSKGYIIDPVTKNDYEYQTTNGGSNFILTVNFVTNDAIKAIKNYGYNNTATIINDKKVSFTKDSSSYMYMASEPPKPFLVSMADSMNAIPADINAKMGISVSTEFKDQAMADWSFNFDAQGDFGDMTYKINADAVKKGSDYYFIINNIPSLLLIGDLGSVKGKWIKLSSNGTSSNPQDSYSSLSYLQDSIPKTEQTYKENREKFVGLIKKVVTIADEEKLIRFKNKPIAEKINGRQLMRYELGLRKESIVPFYNKLLVEINSNADFSDYRNFIDQGLIEYLQSKEFEEVFNYVDNYNLITLWTDTDGFPAIIQNLMKVVPQDTATQLLGKQINITLKLTTDNINKSIKIETPVESVTVEKLISDYNKNLDPMNLQVKSVAVSSNLSNLRAQSELVYDNSGGSYGKELFALGPCKKTPNTLFADVEEVKLLESATDKNISSATCVSKGATGKVTSYAVSAPLPNAEGFSWCVSSDGSSKKIIGSIKSDSCE